MKKSSHHLGRPAITSNQDIRAQLLESAVTLFSQQGIAGTSFAQIARETGVSPAMMHYYFKNRDYLLDTIAEEYLTRFLVYVWEPINSEASVLELVTGLVERITTIIPKMPWFPSLWVREISSEGGLLRERMLNILPIDRLRILFGVIAREQKQGKVHPDIELQWLFVTVLAVTLVPLATKNFWQKMPNVKKEINPKQLAEHITALLGHGLASPMF